MYEPIEVINQRLVDHYGKDVVSGNPHYRIVWSDHQFEVRRGIFTDLDEHGNFIREVEEIRQCEKYPFYPGRWIMEAIVYNTFNPELVGGFNQESYEPLWVFGEVKSCPYPLWRAVVVLVNMHKFVQNEKRKKTPADWTAEELEQIEKERRLCKEILQDASPYIPGMLNSGSAVVVPSTYERSEK